MPRPLTAAVRDLARLVVPVECPGCGMPDVAWCPACAAPFAGRPVRAERAAARLDRLDGVAPLPVWTLARYEGAVRGVVVAWKDKGRVDLDALLAPAAARAAGALAGTLARAVGSRPLLVVPAPSSAAARRVRGREHLAPVARALAAGLGARPAPALRRVRGSDQVGLGVRERGANVAVRADLATLARAARRTGRGGAPVCLIVDDVVTTGATLAAAERCLEAAGTDVVGAFALAATPSPGRTADLVAPRGP
ncbi:ComF family protein [Xylanimonas ulmi]|uniref:Putative amidophosphoribosyltransferase n=1 Tax=Xylanimonas ulmi TaxID=228973 RepID=A0A4V2EXM5_9MICO|nr:ComF family protein [Xylanibacterium ulmi]RZS60010.1 putative amidophosphoribosyltransferase [Xylanibacterium ulmi]